VGGHSMLALLVPLVAVDSMVITGDPLFDLFFTVVLFFGCLALPIAALSSLFRLVLLGTVVSGVLAVGVSEAATSLTLDCSSGGSYSISSWGGAVDSLSLWQSTKFDLSDEVAAGGVAVTPLTTAYVSRCTGWVRITSWNSHLPASLVVACAAGGSAGNLCVGLMKGDDLFTRSFWMAGAGVIGASFLVWAGFRAFA
jgi:hypothetical protein